MAHATSLTWLIAMIAAVLAIVFAIVGASFAGVIVRPIRGVADSLQEGDAPLMTWIIACQTMLAGLALPAVILVMPQWI